MDKIKRFVECTIPISNCNLHCSYCYVIQENRRDTKTSDFKCSPEQIGKAFSQKRWGGPMLVNLCAFGETLMLKELPEITYQLLVQGHYVTITNNGTMSQRLDEMMRIPLELKKHLCFAFSFHYIELVRTGNLQRFIDNVHKVRDGGCSFLVQLNLCDEYIEQIDEIKSICLKEFGALPQVALTRKEGKDFSIFSRYSDEEYFKYGKTFDSPLFEFTFNNFRVKRKEYCYAGDWSFKLDIASGALRSCYFTPPFFNIYDDLEEPIPTSTVGNNCGCNYCVNSSHFMSLGIIPEIACPTYVELRDRNKSWYQPEMYDFLCGKLYDNNKVHSPFKKKVNNIYFKLKYNKYPAIKRLKKGFKAVRGRLASYEKEN